MWPLAAAGIVIDNSSAFRLDPDVPLVSAAGSEFRWLAIRHRGLSPTRSCTRSLCFCWPWLPLQAPTGDCERWVVLSRRYLQHPPSGAGARAMEELRHAHSAPCLWREAVSPMLCPTPWRSTSFLHKLIRFCQRLLREEELENATMKPATSLGYSCGFAG